MKHEPVAPLCKVNRFGTYRLCMLLFFMAHIWDIKITCKGLGVCFNPGKSAC